MTLPFSRLAVIAGLLALLLTGCGDSPEEREAEAQRHVSRAEVYVKQGQYRAALIEARNAIKLAPQSDRSIDAMASLLARIGDDRGLVTFLKERPQLNASQKIMLASAYTRLGKYRSAADALATVAPADRNVEWQLLHARGLSGKGELQQARGALEKLRAQHPDNAGVPLQLARVAVLQQQFDEARQLLDTAIELDRTNTEAWYTRATLQFQLNELEPAATSLTEALANTTDGDMLTVERTRILRLLVQVLTQMGRSDEALIYQRLIAENNPDFLENQSKLSDALELYRQGDLNSAEQILSELYQGNPDDDASALLLGMVNFQNKDFDAASGLFDSHLDAEVASPQLISAAALTRLQMQQSEAALALLEEALESHPKSPDLWSLYGLLLLNSADTSEKGVLAVEKALALDPDRDRLRTALANYYAEQEKYPQALAQLDLVLNRQPDNRGVQTRYLSILVNEGRIADAERFIDRLAKRAGEEDFAVLMFRASLAEARNDADQVEQFLTRAAKANTDAVGPLLALAQQHMRESAWLEAEKYFRQALQREDQSVVAWQGLISSFEARKAADAGVKALRKPIDEQGNRGARTVLIDFFARNGRLAEATPLVQAAPKPDSDYEIATFKRYYKLQASSAAREGNAKLAIEWLQKSLAIDPDDIDALATLGRLHLVSDDHAAAAATATRISALPGGQAFAEELLGDMQLAKANRPKAIEHFRSAWEARPSPVLGRKLMALLRQTGEADAADAFSADWVAQLPDDPVAQLQRANHLQSRGDCEAAAPIYAALLDQLPERPQMIAANNLAMCYLELGDKRALDVARRAYQLGPDVGAVVDTYGWILYQSGDRKAGLELLERALQLSPDNAEIAAHLKAVKEG